MVLLRNEGDILPLDKTGAKAKSIAVIGPLAEDPDNMIDMWGAILLAPDKAVGALRRHSRQSRQRDQSRIRARTERAPPDPIAV